MKEWTSEDAMDTVSHEQPGVGNQSEVSHGPDAPRTRLPVGRRRTAGNARRSKDAGGGEKAVKEMKGDSADKQNYH